MAVSTIGLIAGAASRNASAAAGVTPAAHQRTGHRHRRALAAGQHHAGRPGHRHREAGRRGSARAKNDGGTNTAITADSTTPNTRNGSACTTTETNTVVQVCNRAPSNNCAIGPRSRISTTSTIARNSTEPGR